MRGHRKIGENIMSRIGYERVITTPSDPMGRPFYKNSYVKKNQVKNKRDKLLANIDPALHSDVHCAFKVIGMDPVFTSERETKNIAFEIEKEERVDFDLAIKRANAAVEAIKKARDIKLFN